MRIVTKNDISEPFRAELGEEIFEMIGRPVEIGGTTKHSFVHVVIPPSKLSPSHFHKESEETYYILKGRGEMQIGARRFSLAPGMAVLIMPSEIHQIWNTDPQVALEFITVSAPAWVPTDTYPAELPSSA